jgi:2-succinyl-6-hydroxy-2,4-cyclohexadiene-1-carboxylate synthase
MHLVAEREPVALNKRESVVMLHGFGGTGRSWDDVIAHLPERYRPFALDLPGHGDQLDAPRPISFKGCVQSVLERAPGRFVLAGYSMGGRIALHIALAAPERIERLVIVSATAGIEDNKERSARRKLDRLLADEIEQGSIEDFSERWRAQAMFAEDPTEVDRLARAEHARNRPDGLAAALRGLGTGEMRPLWDRLAEIQLPVTVLAGRRDRKFVRVSEKMVSLMPEGLLQVGAGGHCLLLEHPRSVAAAIA